MSGGWVQKGLWVLPFSRGYGAGQFFRRGYGDKTFEHLTTCRGTCSFNQRFLLATAEASGMSGCVKRNSGTGWVEVLFAQRLKSLLGTKEKPNSLQLSPRWSLTYLGMSCDLVG